MTHAAPFRPGEAQSTGQRHREFALAAGARYFGEGANAIRQLPMVKSNGPAKHRLVDAALPDWAHDIGVGAPVAIPVDAACLGDGNGPDHERCDWLRAAFLHLDGWLERARESQSGPIHSYAVQLPGEWMRAYDRAWVNWIFLFLRRWAARENSVEETTLFGPRPTARFRLTHDVDALKKTLQIRIKSFGMSAIGAMRLTVKGKVISAARRMASGARNALQSADYWLFDEVCAAEKARGFRSDFFFADAGAAAGPTAWLMDPSYTLDNPAIINLVQSLKDDGFGLGVHPGFLSWSDPKMIAHAKNRLERASGAPVTACRQHWLRFSWRDTWAAQIEAGIRKDFTLCFNDRPGFRNGSALRFTPWDEATLRPMTLNATPTVLMDSHFYDYAFPEDPAAAMTPWIDEVVAVGGEAALLWHVHTMHSSIGWGGGYLALLDLLADRGVDVISGGRNV